MQRQLLACVATIVFATFSLRAAEEKRFDPQAHFQGRALIFASVRNASELREGLASTLLGRMALHPGTRRAFEGLSSQIAPKLDQAWAPFVRATGKNPRELLALVEGEISLFWKGIGADGAPEIALAVELGTTKDEILRVLARLEELFEKEQGTKLETEKLGAVEAKAWPAPAGPILEGVLGTHLVIATEGIFREAAAAFSGEAPAKRSKTRLLDPALEKKLSLKRRDVLVLVDVEGLRDLLLKAAGAGRNAGEIQQVLRVSGLEGVKTAALAGGYREGGMECVCHLETSGDLGGILGIIRDGLGSVEIADESLSLIPAAATEVQACRVHPGKILHEIDALVRKEFPDAGRDLDSAYAQLLKFSGISFEKDLCALGDITFLGFSAEPPAGGLFNDQVLLVKTESLPPYWNIFEKLGKLLGAEWGALETADGKIQYLDIAGSKLAQQMSIFRLIESPPRGGPPPQFVVAFLAGTVAMARADLPGGWTALSNLPQALVRYREHYGKGPKLSDDLGALAREKISGAQAASVSRGGKQLLYCYNSILSLAGAFSPFLAFAGIDVAQMPPAEAFLSDLRPAYFRMEMGPDGFTLRCYRVLESSGGIIAVAGGASLMAGFLVPTLVSGRGQAYSMQCANNLKQLFTPAMMYTDKSGTRAFPYSPDGSLASLQLLIDSDPEAFSPKLFVCPESGRSPPEVRDGRIVLTEETCSYDMVPWKVKNTAVNAILIYDKTPCHRGGRNVLYADGSVRWMAESEFQELLPSQRKSAPAKVRVIEKAEPAKIKAAPKPKLKQRVKVQKKEPVEGESE